MITKLKNRLRRSMVTDVRTAMRVSDAAHRLRGRRTRHPSVNAFEVLRLYAQYKGDAYFLQIGSNDGQKNDPIHDLIRDFSWRGILVEPMLRSFKKLADYYSDTRGGRLILENVGISEADGELSFYCLDHQDGDPPWYDQVGSFSEETFIRNICVVDGLEARARNVAIPTMTPESLLKKHGVETLDVLHIDTEGYDAKILQCMDLAALAPDLILFESEWLSEDELASCEARLRALGYVLRVSGGDTLAVQSLLS